MVNTCDEIMEGKVELERLVVSKILRKPVNEYRSMFSHVVAAMQMVQKGKRPRRGEAIDFIYVNASHTNPFRRVVPALLLDKGNYYDREKYLEMVLDVAETLYWAFLVGRYFKRVTLVDSPTAYKNRLLNVPRKSVFY